MFKNLRDQATFQEDEQSLPEMPETLNVRKSRRTLDQMTGMNAQQRFMLSAMLLVIFCLLGFMGLIMLGKVVPTSLF